MKPLRLFPIAAITCWIAAAAFAAPQPRLALHPIASNLPQPTSIVTAGDSRLFITLQQGRIVLYELGAIAPQPFLDLSSLVSCCGERGLLSVVFHPRFRENGYFFVDYTDVNGDTVVARYSVSTSDRDLADSGSATIILSVKQPFDNHNGGELQFGPD